MRLQKPVLRLSVLLVLIGGVHASIGWAANYTILHNFAGADGSNPNGSLVSDGGTLYGMTQNGGADGNGVLFKIGSNGTGYGVVHTFGSGVNDGTNPYGSLVLSGKTLYGMTFSGGDTDGGVVFKVDTDGTGYTILHPFDKTPGVNDGFAPTGDLILSGPTLYGMTSSGGAYGYGSVFKINTDGTGYTILYSFAFLLPDSQFNDGWWPEGSLVLSSATLYGMTSGGGNAQCGTIFALAIDGSSYNILHSFGDGTVADDGVEPYGSLILSGTTLYGMTKLGGAAYYNASVFSGTVFKINTDGTGCTILHSFNDGTVANDGACPLGSLLLSGSTLYGMTSEGGVGTNAGDYQRAGVVFKINTDGTDYSILHSFDNGAVHNDGFGPNGSLILEGPALYGMTFYGGSAGCGLLGTIFSLDVTPGAGFPGAPTGVKAAAGNAEATVSFKAPASDGGNLITGYTVTSNPSDGTDADAGSTSTAHTVTGLTNGKTYTFTVTATNAAGTGPSSTRSNPVTPATVPGAPTGVTATAGNAQATVTFSAPASTGGSAITGYTATSNPGNKKGTGIRSPIRVTGLTNGTTYTFTVTAKNGIGTSPASTSNSVTPCK